MSKEKDEVTEGGIKMWSNLFRGRIYEVGKNYISSVREQVGIEAAEELEKSPQMHFFRRGYSLGLREGHLNAANSFRAIINDSLPDVVPKSEVLGFFNELISEIEGAALVIADEELKADEMITKEEDGVES